MKLKTVLVGCGDRTCVYADLAMHSFDAIEIVAAVDPDIERLKYVQEHFGVSPDKCYSDIKDVLLKGKIGDCVINGTMDQLHVQTAIPFLEQGYDMLLEKPIANNSKELLLLAKVAKEHHCKLMICHVLRFSPFYREIKKILLRGEIGDTMTINTTERVGAYHSSVSYLRGKWNSEEKCGSSFLLAKCCHDIDLISWFNNSSRPTSTFSFGGRDFFNESNAPKGCGNRCMVDCPKAIKDNCVYDAENLYINQDFLPWYPWQCTGKNYQDVSLEEKIESLKTYNPHGKCIYKCGGDILDHQQVLIKFANGVIACHTLNLGAMKADRTIHICGTRGEIEGSASSGKLTVRVFDRDRCFKEEVIDFNDRKGETGGHFGGDKGLVQDFIAYLTGGEPSVSTTVIEDSLISHLIIYDADKSVKVNEPIKFDWEV